MTVQTQKNTIQHLAVEGQDTYSYDFIILSENDVVVLLDGLIYQGGYQVIGLGDDSGSIILDDAISADDDGKILTIARIMDMIQDIDYTAYDGFPAETHERGLDRGILIAQQNAERINASLRMPIGDDAEVVLPLLEARKETFLYFDIEGNATAFDAEPDPISLIAIQIADDSRTMMRVDSSQDAQRPYIGANNINEAFGMLQLNNQGKVPLANMGISGFQLIGPIRGDDLCDKVGDDLGDCIEPDSRNPSQRFPDRVPTAPGEQGKFSTGDVFLLTFQEPEVDGTMFLYAERGGIEAVIPVGPRDAIVFSAGWDQNGDPTPDFPQGWYYIPKLYEVGDANSIVYTPDGGFIIPAAAINVQVAIDALDQNAVDTQNRDQSVDGSKTFTSALTQLAEGISPNHLMRKVDIEAILASHADAINNPHSVTAAQVGAPGGSWTWNGTTLAITIP